MTAAELVRFAGVRAAEWLQRNCGSCETSKGCPLKAGLFKALEARTPIPGPVADRLGVPKDGLFGPWTCREWSPRPTQAGPEAKSPRSPKPPQS